ncbi:MAG: recombinase family protein [Thermodesulfobacteriota bacterium]
MDLHKQIKKLRAAIYIRVSTDDQLKGFSPEFQLEDCRRAAVERDDCTLKGVHIFDDSKSGSSDDRPGWKKLMETAKQGEIDVIYFWKLDRMMRSERHFYKNEEELEKLNIQLRFATQNLDDPFTRAIQVAVAAEERRKILERTRRGREMAVRAGKWVMGTPPYGYKYNGKTKKLDINEEQAQWVKKFYEWLVNEKCSLKEIARRANAFGVPTWTQSIKTKRKTSKIWWPRTLGRILTNETYTGKAYFRKYKRNHKGLKTYENEDYMRAKTEWIPIEVPQIISKNLFDKTIVQLRKNSEFAKRKKIRSYMFSGLVYCSKCGFKLKGNYANPSSRSAKGSRCYVGYVPKNHVGNTRRCRYCGAIAETRLMPIWNTLENILMSPDTIYDKLDKYTGENKKDGLLNKIVLIDKELKSLNEEQERTNIAFLEICSIDENEYKQRIKSIKSRQVTLEHERRKYNDYIISEEERIKRVDTITNLYQKIKYKITHASYETKSKILHIFVDRIDLNLDTSAALVKFNIPMDVHHNFEGQLLGRQSLKKEEITSDKWLNDNNETKDFGNFYLDVQVPLISFKEIQKVTTPSHSRYYKGEKDMPLLKLTRKKAEDKELRAYFQ